MASFNKNFLSTTLGISFLYFIAGTMLVVGNVFLILALLLGELSARIKAAEYGIPIAIANEDGISQIIDQRGKVLAELGFGEVGRLDYKIGLTNEKTPYLLWGEKFELLLFAGSLFWFSNIKKRLSKKTGNVLNLQKEGKENE